MENIGEHNHRKIFDAACFLIYSHPDLLIINYKEVIEYIY